MDNEIHAPERLTLTRQKIINSRKKRKSKLLSELNLRAGANSSNQESYICQDPLISNY